jgi:RNA polymerase sigma factor (sigma-70 family)
MNVTGASRRPEPDRRRFERLYEQYFDRVAAYLVARTDRDSAAEGVARTFEIAWRRIADVPVEPLPWLLGVARRVLAEQRRAHGRRSALIERISATAVAASDDHAEAAATRELVLAAIDALSPAQQEAFLLIAWDGLSEREAAAVLGCSRGAVALRLHRARKQLRVALKHAAPASDLLGDAPSDAAPRGPIHPWPKETA